MLQEIIIFLNFIIITCKWNKQNINSSESCNKVTPTFKMLMKKPLFLLGLPEPVSQLFSIGSSSTLWLEKERETHTMLI